MSKNAKYVVCVDPFDGSSNIDVNVSIGTIFSIYRLYLRHGIEETDYLHGNRGRSPPAYIIYGLSTMLAWATTGRSQRLTLDPSIGNFASRTLT